MAIYSIQRQVYQPFLTEEQQERLSQDQSFLENEFNKFLIESVFKNKGEFGVELGRMEKIEVL